MLALLGVANDGSRGDARLRRGRRGHRRQDRARRRRAPARARRRAARSLCITHLPQIASLAARHFSIEKDPRAEPALTTVHELAAAQVVGELVRMLGADEDDGAARRHAQGAAESGLSARRGGGSASVAAACRLRPCARRHPRRALSALRAGDGLGRRSGLDSRWSSAAEHAAVAGPARLGRKTKLLVKRLRPGRRRGHRPPQPRPRLGRGPDRGRRRRGAQLPPVVQPATTRTWARCCSSRPGSRSSTCRTTRCSSASRTATRSSCAAARSGCAASALVRGDWQDPSDVLAATERRRRDIGEALEAFARNTVEHMVEEQELLAGKIELPRFDTDFRDRPALVVVRGVDHQADLQALRPFIRDVQAGARRRRRRRQRDPRGGLRARHDRRRHGLGVRGDAALRRRARRPRLRRRARAGPRATRAARACRTRSCPAPGTSQDIAMLIAHEKGASLIVSVGSQFNLVEFLDKNRRGMSSTFLTRLRLGEKLVDAKGVSRLYRPAPGAGARAARARRRHRGARRRRARDARAARRRRPAVAEAASCCSGCRLRAPVFDFRYHAISLAAVLVALVVGVLLGVAIGDAGLVSSAEQNLRADLREDVGRAQDRAADLESKLGEQRRRAQRYDDASTRCSSAGASTAVRVGLVFLGAPSRKVRDAVADALEPHGREADRDAVAARAARPRRARQGGREGTRYSALERRPGAARRLRAPDRRAARQGGKLLRSESRALFATRAGNARAVRRRSSIARRPPKGLDRRASASDGRARGRADRRAQGPPPIAVAGVEPTRLHPVAGAVVPRPRALERRQRRRGRRPGGARLRARRSSAVASAPARWPRGCCRRRGRRAAAGSARRSARARAPRRPAADRARRRDPALVSGIAPGHAWFDVSRRARPSTSELLSPVADHSDAVLVVTVMRESRRTRLGRERSTPTRGVRALLTLIL